MAHPGPAATMRTRQATRTAPAWPRC